MVNLICFIVGSVNLDERNLKSPRDKKQLSGHRKVDSCRSSISTLKKLLSFARSDALSKRRWMGNVLLRQYLLLRVIRSSWERHLQSFRLPSYQTNFLPNLFFVLPSVAHSSSVLAKLESNTLGRMCGKPRCLLL